MSSSGRKEIFRLGTAAGAELGLLLLFWAAPRPFLRPFCAWFWFCLACLAAALPTCCLMAALVGAAVAARPRRLAVVAARLAWAPPTLLAALVTLVRVATEPLALLPPLALVRFFLLAAWMVGLVEDCARNKNFQSSQVSAHEEEGTHTLAVVGAGLAATFFLGAAFLAGLLLVAMMSAAEGIALRFSSCQITIKAEFLQKIVAYQETY